MPSLSVYSFRVEHSSVEHLLILNQIQFQVRLIVEFLLVADLKGRHLTNFALIDYFQS